MKVVFTALVKVPGRTYSCPRNPDERVHQLGKDVGWFAKRGTLCGFFWDAVEFPNEEAMRRAVAQAGGELLDFFKIV